MNTEAMPKAAPAATASSTLRTVARRTFRAARNSTATPAPVAASRVLCSAPDKDCSARPPPPVRASSPASPTVASTAPRQAAPLERRPTKTAAIGSAKTMVSAPSGCTRLSGPYASATTCSSAPKPFRAMAAYQPAWRTGA
ncbi:hypothetical protein DRB96_05495 [Streptomyces sp. ICC1]|nr:hypothetical protein DRB89_05960 [Streptomyces sp. ICC4]AWZ11858.1 hypothetical protein DRB96_05495 [Streptomyces sp. ICC1]